MKSRASRFSRFGIAAAFALAALGLGAARAQNVTVEAAFSPQQLRAGQVGTYMIDVKGIMTVLTPEIPPVPNLEMGNPQTSRSSSFNMNTNTLVSTSGVRMLVRASKPGQYVIPAFDITVDGKKYRVPEAKLEVLDGSASAMANAPGQEQVISLTVVVPRKELYVGEKFPLDLVLSLRVGVQAEIAGQVVQEGDAFDHVRLYDNPEQGEFLRNGQRYLDVTWKFAVTALKAGEQKLRFFQPMRVARPGGGMQINDPILEQLIGRGLPNVFAQMEAVNLESAPLTLNVQPLPEAGRPVNFTGGIGNFSVGRQNLSATDLQVGVPVTLRLTVTGNGNFDLLHAPTLDLGAPWRAYAPKETFEASDRTGYRGAKTFEYVLMPMSENITALTMPDFNFFNPETKTYVEIPLPPIPVKVKPAPPGQALPPLPAVSTPAAAAPKAELVGLHFEPGTWLPPQPRPLFYSPYFWAAQTAPAIVLGALVITRSRRLRLENDPVYARRQRARRESQAALARARAAAAAGKAPEFYAMAQRALQEAASHDRTDVAEALTWQDFDAHLTARNTPAEIRDQTREIFEAGDALRFGGFAPDQAALTSAVQRLDGLVQKLLKRS